MIQSPNHSIHVVAVIGAGTMGHGIAQVLLRGGYSVILHDVSSKLLASATDKISRGLGRDVEKGRLTTEQKDQALGRLATTAQIADLAPSGFVIEAVTENFEIKAGIFRSLEPVFGATRPHVIFASNTSSISITKLAATTSRAAQFIGMHFFNPVPVMKLVELVPGLQTAPETIVAAEALAKSTGKDKSLAGYLRAHLNRLGAGDYFALLAFIEMNSEHEASLRGIRHMLRNKKRVATCLGFGPRFLHSTGQAYKGGPNSGVFLQVTCDDAADLPVPGQNYTFGVVKAAQARGDFQVLAERGRRALRVHLGKDLKSGLATLTAAIREALS